MIETAAYSFPPRIETVPDEMKAAWAEVASLVRAPAARARLNDLLWVCSYGESRHTRARAAIDAYLEIAEEWRDLSKVDCLARAIELSLQLGDEKTANEVATRIGAAAHSALDETDQKPGVALRLIQLLVEMPVPPASVDALLEAADARLPHKRPDRRFDRRHASLSCPRRPESC